MNARAQAGDLAGARALYQRFLPLIVLEQQPGVATRKEIYRRRGLIACGHVRHPAPPLSAAAAAAVEAELGRALPGIDVTVPLEASVFTP